MPRRNGDVPAMAYHQPYLETCCRSALHRLKRAAEAGRPDGLTDGGCLRRLETLGLAAPRADGRWTMTERGLAQHAQDALLAPR